MHAKMKHYLNRKPFMSEVNNKITIELDTLESTDALDPKHLIFQEQYDLLVKKIRRKSKENRARLTKKECGEHKKQNDEARGVPCCFFIDGTRGSGKSTLMRAVRERLIKCEGDDEGLYPLADVDPTELGKGENFFLYLLGRIYRLLDDRFKKNDICDEKVGQIREAMEALRKMSGGLQVLMDSDGALKESDNPDFFLEKCVDKCADSSLLRKKLCELLGNVAKIVGKEIFLVTIDDADLNFSKCEDVLEYVRKYMQTPRLIFLFAGDMQLYSHIVRSIQMKSFGETILQYDGTHVPHRNQMVDRLEDQYLMKLFPADFRVKMPTIAENPDVKNRIEIAARKEEETKTTELPSISQAMKSFLQPAFGALDDRVAESIFVSLPLRSILFMLRDWYVATEDANKESCEMDRSVANGIQKAALSALVKNNINYYAISDQDFQTLMDPLISYLTKQDAWKDNLDFMPTDGSQDDLLLSTYFGALVTSSTKDLPSKLLCLCTLYPQSYRGPRRYSDRVGRDTMIPLLTKQENWSIYGAIACATMAPAVPSGANFVRRYGKGVVRLMQDGQTLDKEKGTMRRISFESLLRRIGSAIESKENRTECKLGLALAYSICYIQDARERGYYLSLYNLILRAAEFLNIAKRKKISLQSNNSGETEKNEYELKKWIKEYLEKVNDFSGFSRDSGRISRYREIGDDIMQGSENVSDFGLPGVKGADDEIVEEFYTWINCFADETYTTTPTLYSSCWSRFLWRCDEETKNFSLRFERKENAPQAGILLKSYMKAFIDALDNTLKPSGEEKKTMADCVKEFPLWKVLFEADEQTSALFSSLNEVNVGALRYSGFIEEMTRANALLDEKTAVLKEVEARLSKEQANLIKAKESERTAYYQLRKENAKVVGLENSEKDYSEQESAAHAQVLNLRATVKNLWNEIQNGEVQLAALEAELKVVFDASLQKELEKRLENRKKTPRSKLSTEEQIQTQFEIQRLQNQIDEIVAQNKSPKNIERVKTLAENKALLKVLREKLKETNKSLLAAEKTWRSTQTHTPKARKDLYTAQAECKKLEEIWKNKDEELQDIRKKVSSLKEEVKSARAEKKKAENNLEKVKKSDAGE